MNRNLLAIVVDPEAKEYEQQVVLIDIIHGLPEIAYVAIDREGATHTVWHHQVRININSALAG